MYLVLVYVLYSRRIHSVLNVFLKKKQKNNLRHVKLPCQTPTSSSPFWKIFSFWIFYWWKMIHRLKLLFGDVFSSHSSQCFGLQWERKCWQCAVWASYCCFLYCNNIKPTSDPGEGGIVGSCGHSDSSGNERGSVTLLFIHCTENLTFSFSWHFRGYSCSQWFSLLLHIFPHRLSLMFTLTLGQLQTCKANKNSIFICVATFKHQLLPVLVFDVDSSLVINMNPWL